jgi:Peptidase_C39 like family
MLARVVPPSCLCGVERGAVGRRDGEDTLIECGVWTPRRAAVHLVPSFAPLAPVPPAFRFELSARAAGAWSPWVATVTLGDAEFPALPPAASPLTTDIDEVHATRPVEALRLRVRCRGALPDTWLASLSAAAEDRVDAGVPPGAGTSLRVPALSQIDEDPAIALRICSPSSVAMVLGYWGRAVTAAAVAADAFHPATDLYGVWPAAIRAAAARGVAGYLLRFPDWTAAAWCLTRRLPIIASIRYAAGELRGAPMAATTGHLVVLTGYEDGTVLVNDPAAPTRDAVPRRYRRDELTRAWLDRKGIGYVLFDPARV